MYVCMYIYIYIYTDVRVGCVEGLSIGRRIAMREDTRMGVA